MHTHKLEVLPQTPEFAAQLDEFARDGWELAGFAAGHVQVGGGPRMNDGGILVQTPPQVSPAFFCVLRRPAVLPEPEPPSAFAELVQRTMEFNLGGKLTDGDVRRNGPAT